MSLFQENTRVLSEIAGRGIQLELPRLVDFSHVFPDSPSARKFATEVEIEGFEAVVEEGGRDTTPWDVTVSKVMIPNCENITRTEEHLDRLAQRHGGRSDGWGFLSPPDGSG